MAAKQIVLASTNAGKAKELQKHLSDWTLLTLRDIGFDQEIPEPYETFHENALTKAKTVFESCHQPVIADDSGLIVDALNGAPGVHSAYYGGEHGNAQKNIQRLLSEMKGVENRRAYFISVICFYDGQQTQYFEGRCYGTIAEQPLGEEGFGYDPVFIPDGSSLSFAQIATEAKNAISHRGKAVDAFLTFMQSYQLWNFQ